MVKRVPPICLCCRQPLVEVLENDYTTYVFDSVSGTYKCDEFKGYLEMFCPNCGADLYDVFPDGACNYSSKRKIKRISTQ
ncbi:MAG: hypothetical protein NWE94_01400 [Candidatus Bathyarchaeota archaeon]|nr:hypothetical protein [Candidatus Bathyarchaeota archaeon]